MCVCVCVCVCVRCCGLNLALKKVGGGCTGVSEGCLIESMMLPWRSYIIHIDITKFQKKVRNNTRSRQSDRG